MRSTALTRLIAVTGFAVACLMGLTGLTVLEQIQGPSLEPSEIDVGFAQSMIIHHNQALQMAEILSHNASAEAQGLAKSIFNSQLLEVGQMQGWLTAWGKPVVLVGPPMAYVQNAKGLKRIEDILYAQRCNGLDGAMEGLASPAQLQTLRTLQGEAQLKFFMQLMIPHHKAALEMAAFAVRNAKLSVVQSFAQNIILEQNTEIGWMQNQLDRL